MTTWWNFQLYLKLHSNSKRFNINFWGRNFLTNLQQRSGREMQGNSVSKGTQQKLHKHFQHPLKITQKTLNPHRTRPVPLGNSIKSILGHLHKAVFRSGNQKRPLLAHDQSLPTKKNTPCSIGVPYNKPWHKDPYWPTSKSTHHHRRRIVPFTISSRTSGGELSHESWLVEGDPCINKGYLLRYRDISLMVAKCRIKINLSDVLFSTENTTSHPKQQGCHLPQRPSHSIRESRRWAEHQVAIHMHDGDEMSQLFQRFVFKAVTCTYGSVETWRATPSSSVSHGPLVHQI